jgi:hypothetical protein
MVGVGSVFSREFYELAARRLKPGGIMAQWFHVYEMNDGIVELVLRTFGSVFPVVEVWDAHSGDIVILGSRQPWKTGPELFAKAFAMEATRRHLAQIGLRVPEAVLARQIASQRTGFALTGPGPIQTDEFPVLEYAAPRAFFIGRSAQFLQRFDERTWQADIAPPEKNRLLRALSPEQLKAVFAGEYGSVNNDVLSCVNRRIGPEPGRTRERLGGGFSPPCIFDTKASVALKRPPGIEADERARQLFAAEAALQTEGTDRAQALQEISRVLLGESAQDRAKPLWHADYYACLAAKASLDMGYPAQARRFLVRGLELAPDSGQLRFLAHIMVRERVLQPKELPLASLTQSGIGAF